MDTSKKWVKKNKATGGMALVAGPPQHTTGWQETEFELYAASADIAKENGHMDMHDNWNLYYGIAATVDEESIDELIREHSESEVREKPRRRKSKSVEDLEE